MGVEVIFFPVGDGEKGGDAILIRYGNLFGPPSGQRLIVVDGGTTTAGEAIVSHATNVWGISRANVVVSTHPHADHTSGLTPVLENMKVDWLWMHQPWARSGRMRALLERARSGVPSSEDLWRSIAAAHDLEDLAIKRGVPIVEPFAGVCSDDRCFGVLGPSQDYYDSLLTQFEQPEAKSESLFSKLLLGSPFPYGAETREEEATSPDWGLTDDEEGTPENNSSAVTVLYVDGGWRVLTADAGIPALDRAFDFGASNWSVPFNNLALFQVPHHGSRHNIGPRILNRLIGSKLAVISAPKEGEKHPSQRVVNALIDRGVIPYATKGNSLRDSKDAPPGNWVTATPLPSKPIIDD